MLRTFIILFVPLFIYAQSSNWNSVVDLNRSVNWNDRIDLYSDADGNHILIENGSTLKYYLYNYAGSYVRTYTIDNSISATYSKLTGWDGTLYVSYKEGSTIYTKKSSNAGQSWSALDNITLGDSDSDGLELWTDGDGLHITYSEWDDNNDTYETYYKLYDPDDDQWENDKTVTDESEMVGGRPSVTTSSNRVHVAFNELYEEAYTRDKNTTWQTSQTISNWYTIRNMVISTSSKLHALYFELNYPKVNFKYKNRNFSSSTWSSSILIADQTGTSEYSKPDMAVSANDKMHMAYYYKGDLEYREWDGSMSTAFDVLELYEAPRIATDGNDIYVIGITDDGSYGYELKMRHRDYSPIAPTLSIDASGDNPVLSWNKPNADIDEYKIYRKTENGNYNLIYTASSSPWTDENIDLSMPDTRFGYKIKAVDYEDNYSDYSNEEIVWGMRKPAYSKYGKSLPMNYSLKQNFPNPFNPVTSIEFALPKANNTLLQVIDLNGKLVTTLLDGYLEAGIYGFDFNGQHLSSGIYIYKLTSGDYTAVKRMLLVK